MIAASGLGSCSRSRSHNLLESQDALEMIPPHTPLDQMYRL